MSISLKLKLVGVNIVTSAVFAAAFAAFAAPAVAQSAPQGKVDTTKTNVSMCIGCHEIGGYKASFPTVYSVPLIHGQTAKYLEAALQAYKKGERSHPSMRAIAASLSDAEMASLAAYFAGNAKK